MDLEQRSFGRTTEQNGLTKGERVPSFLQDDMLVPARYFDDRRGKTLLEPETRLMFAILEDAVRCFQENCSARYGERKRLFNQAQGWIFEVRDDWIFGFENICSVLELNADYIRKGLARWKEKELLKLSCAPFLKTSTLNNSPSRQIESDMRARSLAS